MMIYLVAVAAGVLTFYYICLSPLNNFPYQHTVAYMPRVIEGGVPFVETVVGIIDVNVAGMTYYKFNSSLMKSGNTIIFERESSNKFDSNAIKVIHQPDNHSTEQIGHLPRSTSAILSSLIDTKTINIEGYISVITSNMKQLTITITVYSLLQSVVCGKTNSLMQCPGWIAASPMNWKC